MKNKVLKVAMIVMLIITMTISDFILVGVNVVHALENANSETNHANVKFAAYFKAEDKEVSRTQYEIDSEEMKLGIKVQVLDEGYFDGVITLKNSNFKLKQEVLSKDVSKIEGNTITLNRVNAGNTVEIELGIEPIIEENYGADMLNKESVLKLTGNYEDSTQKKIEINAEKKVTLTLLAPSDIDTILEGRVITNKLHKIEDANKRMVQIDLDSTVLENKYPIDKTTFKINLPAGVELVEVITKGTYATNGESDRKIENFTWDKINNLLQVTIENLSEDGKISWKKDAIDNIVVTLILPENTTIGTEEYSIKSTVELKGNENKSLVKEIKYNLTDEAEGTIKATVENKEEIYKGKIYSKGEREYNSITNIEVNYSNLTEKTTIVEKTVYRTETEEKLANIEYKTTTITYSEFKKIFKGMGSLLIKDQNGNTVKEVKITDFDDEGNLVITYESGVKGLIIEMPEALSTGIIRLKHKKVIKAEEYSKDEISALKYLVEQVDVSYSLSDKTIAQHRFEKLNQLGETKTVAELTTKPHTLSTAALNEQVKFAVTLKTDGEQYDLYSNPTITIKLPEGITNVSNIQAIPFHLGECTANANYNANTREIKVILSNVNQTTYNGSNTNGYIEILADIELDEKIPNREDVITLTYTNEKAVSYENEGKIEAEVNIFGHSGLVAFNYLTSHNLKTNSVTSKEEQIGNLKMYQSADNADFKIALINNTGNDVANVKVLGNFPVEGKVTVGKYTFENTIAATVKSGINIEAGTATVYYTSNANATKELDNAENGWNSNLYEVTNPVLYMIVIENMAKQTNLIANYIMTIPENLQYDKDMRASYTVDYATNISSSTVNAIPVGLETGKIFANLEATVGTEKLEDGMTVKAGEVIRYKVTITNTGSNEAKNVKITGLVPEGTVHVKPLEIKLGTETLDPTYEGEDDSGAVIEGIKEGYLHSGETYYEEIETTSVEEIIETLSSGKTHVFEYEVRVKSDITEPTAENQITVTYNEDIEIKSNKLTNNLMKANIRVTVKRVANVIPLAPEVVGQYFVIVENISNVEQKDIKMKFNMPTKDFTTLNHVEEIGGQLMEKNLEWTIESISAGQYKIYSFYLKVNKIKELVTQANLSAIATQSEVTYRSNVYSEPMYGFDVEAKMSSPNEGEYVKTDDLIEYHIEIKNKSQIEKEVTLVDNIPEQLSIQRIEIDGNLYAEDILSNSIYEILNIAPGETINIKIYTIVNYDKTRLENQTITNIAKILFVGEELTSTQEISHIVESIVIKDEEPETPEGPTLDPEEPPVTPDYPPVDPEDPPVDPEDPPVDPEDPPVDPEDPPVDPEDPPVDPEDPPVDPEDPPVDPEDPPVDPEKKKYDISGKVWVDQDKDGELNNSDNIIKGIKVRLLNVETNEFLRNEEKNKDLIVETGEEGYYLFEDIIEGTYVVVFEYDDTLYAPTTYQKEGVAESKNSNVVSKILDINGTKKQYATTNEIKLNSNIANINMGLVFVKQFDIKVEKYISKVIVQTAKDSTTYGFQDKNFAKIEINKNTIIGSTILVQYTIKATNIGDVEAYLNTIVDYAPAGLKFNSELNKEWYQVGNDLYTNALNKEAIAPGESKEVNLTLIKTKTDGNAELINNMAEVQEAYNIYGILDINSTQANKNKDENDLGTADILISIQTGTLFNYIALTISMLGLIGVAAYIINKRILKVEF